MSLFDHLSFKKALFLLHLHTNLELSKLVLIPFAVRAFQRRNLQLFDKFQVSAKLRSLQTLQLLVTLIYYPLKKHFVVFVLFGKEWELGKNISTSVLFFFSFLFRQYLFLTFVPKAWGLSRELTLQKIQRLFRTSVRHKHTVRKVMFLHSSNTMDNL